MKSFKDVVEKKDEKKNDVKKPSKSSWIRTKTGWIVRFIVEGKEYVLKLVSESGADSWSFVWYHMGEGLSSNITKFGSYLEWQKIMPDVIDILRDFIRVYSPQRIRFSGFSYKSNQVYYRVLWKIMKPYRYAFRGLGYKTSFDMGNFEAAPSYVISKLSDAGDKKKEIKKKINSK